MQKRCGAWTYLQIGDTDLWHTQHATLTSFLSADFSQYSDIDTKQVREAFAVGRHNDNDNDTLREVPHPSNEGLALQAKVGAMTPQKESVLLV